MEEILTLDHPDSRAHEQELTSDLPGRTFDSNGQGRHVMGTSVEPKQQETITFAKQIAEHLDTHRKAGDYSKLVIFAAPAFLGLLRENMNAHTNKLVVHECNKNLVQLSVDKIREHIPYPLPILSE
ncbi:MAG: host attachment protein [Gammaproteobacteria bacterium]|nr:host attachment protein [Gammaproteobacteria bacterium]